MQTPEDKGSSTSADENEQRGREARVGLVIVALVRLPGDALVDEAALAASLDVTKRTVRRMVRRHELPPPVAFAGRAMWQVRRVVAWFEARAERAARAAERDARRLDSVR